MSLFADEVKRLTMDARRKQSLQEKIDHEKTMHELKAIIEQKYVIIDEKIIEQAKKGYDLIGIAFYNYDVEEFELLSEATLNEEDGILYIPGVCDDLDEEADFREKMQERRSLAYSILQEHYSSEGFNVKNLQHLIFISWKK